MKWPDMIRYYSNAYFGCLKSQMGRNVEHDNFNYALFYFRVQTKGDVTRWNFECQSWLASAVFRKLIGGSSYRMSRMRKPFWQFKMEKNFPCFAGNRKKKSFAIVFVLKKKRENCSNTIRRNEDISGKRKTRDHLLTFSDVSQYVITDIKVLEMLSSHQHVFGNDRHIVVGQV